MAKSGELRRIETEVSDGPGDTRTEASYVYGVEYEGAFIPIRTFNAGYVDHLTERAASQDQPAQGSTSETSGKRSGSTSGA